MQLLLIELLMREYAFIVFIILNNNYYFMFLQVEKMSFVVQARGQVLAGYSMDPLAPAGRKL